ncbi:MAG: hypothetical protein P8K65_08670 [Acidimicrobiales bacterium]|nr:hypothetical protein [Acidimicrobiales bacterium]
MDTLTTVRRLADPIGSLGARFMLDRTTFGRCTDLGLPSGMAGSGSWATCRSLSRR